MPPKPKFTRAEAAAAALEIIKAEGLEALTARELGKRLGTSASPIFTIFYNMDDVKQAARELALDEFGGYIEDYKNYVPAFKRIGTMIVLYGVNQPELFKLLFMQQHYDEDFVSTVSDLGSWAEVCVDTIRRDYGLSEENSKMLFEQMWTYAFGLGAMCANGVCRLSEEEIGKRLGIAFAGHIMLIKSGRINEVYSDVELNSNGYYHGHEVGDFSIKP